MIANLYFKVLARSSLSTNDISKSKREEWRVGKMSTDFRLDLRTSEVVFLQEKRLKQIYSNPI